MAIKCKLKECTKAMQNDLDDIKTVTRQLSEENQGLKTKLENATTKLEAAENRSKTALRMAHHNEQYSRKK